MLNQEVANRWEVMTAVVDHKKEVIESTQKQMRMYEERMEKLTDLLNRAETTLAAMSTSGADVNKAKANRDTLKVSGCPMTHQCLRLWNLLHGLLAFILKLFIMQGNIREVTGIC